MGKYKIVTIDDILKSLSLKELEMIEKGKKHWKNMSVLNERHDGYVQSDTIKELIDRIVENVWIHAADFYTSSNNTEKPE
jgi:hypothetical protein